MSEPTLAMIQAERAAEQANATVLKAKQEEQVRVAEKRRLLIGFAQGLEELDRELAASKALRAKLKESEAALKVARDEAYQAGGEDDISPEDIIAHTETVRKAARESAKNRGLFVFDFGGRGGINSSRFVIRTEKNRVQDEAINAMLRECCGQQGAIKAA